MRVGGCAFSSVPGWAKIGRCWRRDRGLQAGGRAGQAVAVRLGRMTVLDWLEPAACDGPFRRASAAQGFFWRSRGAVDAGRSRAVSRVGRRPVTVTSSHPGGNDFALPPGWQAAARPLLLEPCPASRPRGDVVSVTIDDRGRGAADPSWPPTLSLCTLPESTAASRLPARAAPTHNHDALGTSYGCATRLVLQFDRRF